jgi:hypothetical protein
MLTRARISVHGPERESLTLYIAWELNRLKSADTLTGEPWPGFAEDG